MDENVLFFFEGHQEALPLYEKFEERVLSEISGVRIRVQKTQISFSNRYMFACVSLQSCGRQRSVRRPISWSPSGWITGKIRPVLMWPQKRIPADGPIM